MRNHYPARYVLALLLTFCGRAIAQGPALFTPAEQQQISITTAGLFAGGNTFTIDFTTSDDTDYSFPLPVGKATLRNGYLLEIVTTKGDAVKAMFDGAVRLSRNNSQYGHVIVIRHDNGLETMYAGNAQNLVKVGQRVRAGQTIAIVGDNGGRYACLFAVMVNGGWIAPTIVFDPVSHRLHRQVIRCRRVGGHVDVSVVKQDDRGMTLDPDKEPANPFAHKNTFRLNLSKMTSEHWAYPLPGSHVISPYGGSRHHSGIDLKTRPNDRIVAAFDGIVTRSGRFSGYGNCIILRHAYGFETLYGHQSKNLVKVGQKVKAGQVIGLTGRTGRATTEHLHFEIKHKGQRLNPATIYQCNTRKLKHITLVLSKNGRLKIEKN